MAVSLLRLIKQRRSIRKYTQKHIAQDLITRILEAGRWAPSGLNNQPWRFITVRDPLLKTRLAKLTESSSTVHSANVIISVFLDRRAIYNRTKDAQAAGACIQNMLLEAHSMGLGACWLGEILNQKKNVCRLLGTPSHYELMALISLGWVKKRSYKGSRKNLKSLVYKQL